MSGLLHLAHVVLAGVWLGGIVFTTAVVSPAFNAIKWSEAERVAARSVVGRRYARVGGANLGLLSLFAFLDGAFGGFGVGLYAEYALHLVIFGLVAAHATYFGRRRAGLAGLAEAERGRRAERRPGPSPNGVARSRRSPRGPPRSTCWSA